MLNLTRTYRCAMPVDDVFSALFSEQFQPEVAPFLYEKKRSAEKLVVYRPCVPNGWLFYHNSFAPDVRVFVQAEGADSWITLSFALMPRVKNLLVLYFCILAVFEMTMLAVAFMQGFFWELLIIPLLSLFLLGVAYLAFWLSSKAWERQFLEHIHAFGSVLRR